MSSQGHSRPRLNVCVWIVSPLILGKVTLCGEWMVQNLNQAGQALSTDNCPGESAGLTMYSCLTVQEPQGGAGPALSHASEGLLLIWAINRAAVQNVTKGLGVSCHLNKLLHSWGRTPPTLC